MEKTAIQKWTVTAAPGEIYFYLGNAPGRVYIGTESDLEWYERDGQCPGRLSSPVVRDEDGAWDILHLESMNYIQPPSNLCSQLSGCVE